MCICTKVSDNGQKYEFYIKLKADRAESGATLKASYQNTDINDIVFKSETFGTLPVVVGKLSVFNIVFFKSSRKLEYVDAYYYIDH